MLKNAGSSYRNIAKELNVNVSTISRLLKKNEKCRLNAIYFQSGRKSIINKYEKLNIKRCINNNPFLSAKEVRSACQLLLERSRE